MMFLLVCDVSLHAASRRRAYGKGAVTFLPSEFRQTDFVMHPRR